MPSLAAAPDVHAPTSAGMLTVIPVPTGAPEALLKLAAPLPAANVPARIGARVIMRVGDAFMVAGLGVSVRGDGRTGGTLRAARLVRTSLEVNGGICRSLLQFRHGLSEEVGS